MNQTYLHILYFHVSACIFFLMLPQKNFAQSDFSPAAKYFETLNTSHDLNLSTWGPYSKKYAGISHIPDFKSGMRFDFSVMPGYYRNKVLIPNVRYESGYYPWDFSADLRKFTYRYELEWKDRVYVDVNYTIIDENTVLVAMHSVNQSNRMQNLTLNLMAYTDYPENYATQKLGSKESADWINAVDYTSLTFGKKHTADHLVYDGWMRAEIRNSNFVNGRALGKDFGNDVGDKVSYKINITAAKLSGSINFMYKVPAGKEASFTLNGLINQPIVFKGTGKFENKAVHYTASSTGVKELSMTADGTSGIEMNGFTVSNGKTATILALQPQNKNFEPIIMENAAAKNMVLKYPDMHPYYGIGWDTEPYKVRAFRNNELDLFFKEQVHNHVDKVIRGNNLGNYSNVFISPLELAANSDKTVYALICTGTESEVKQKLHLFNTSKSSFIKTVDSSPLPRLLPEATPYLFSQKMMKAALLSNIVYPVYTQNSYIRHFTPGKWWNSLYTWDSGFIALGLAEVNPTLAIETLNSYTTQVGAQSAFIHHGSMLPVQVYVFQELFNQTQSKELLHYFYPRLKQYYNFLAGNSGNSSTRIFISNLLKTWDYFYNSGGWDDYPAQVEVHKQAKEQYITPVVVTAQAIRFAKILRMVAIMLNKKADVNLYDQDIAAFSTALQKNSWDEKEGYFGYVVHDSLGNAKEIFNDPASGRNLNMGLDGAYPLLSGICSKEQEDILLDKIFSEGHMWTKYGISTVDQSAPYYRTDGYWNGSVWMPHQWFIWKTMLDLGKPELAWRIAKTGLDVWKKETDYSYYTFEHFLAKTGNGAGWHQFSGLSTPVLSWFAASYKLGTLTTGFEVWVGEKKFNSDFSTLKATLFFDNATRPHVRSVLVCINPDKQYTVSFRGKKIAFNYQAKGLLQINLPSTNNSGILQVLPVG